MKIVAVILDTTAGILNDDTSRIIAATAGRLLLHMLVWVLQMVGNIQ